MIQYVRYHEIDLHRWDACIAAADNGLIYATSQYLNEMAVNWDGLIMDDYAAVMPLTYKKKYSIYYLYQPYFTAALGVFGTSVTAQLIQQFLLAIPVKFKYWDISLNHKNYFDIPGFTLNKRTNYVLDLNKPYEIIYKNYRENVRRNIKKSTLLKCIIRKNISINEVIVLAKEQSKYFAPINELDYQHLKSLYQKLADKNEAVTYGIYLGSGQLVASCALFFYQKRIYYILVGNHPNGKTIGASHSLIDAFIKDYAGTNLLIDFEGSDVPSLAFFYAGFGAIAEFYAGLKLNRLPPILKFLKK